MNNQRQQEKTYQIIREILSTKAQAVRKVHNRNAWVMTCLLCKREFVTTNCNPKGQPRLCPTCTSGAYVCTVCGKVTIPFGRIMCGACFKDSREELFSVQKGHKKQAKKLLGELNPAKELDSRRKISIGVKNSYENDPKLCKARGYWNDNRKHRMSVLESQVAQILVSMGLPFQYEKRLDFGDSYGYPDFIVDEIVLIEVAGFILNDSSVDAYVKKITKYGKKYQQVIIVTFPDTVGAFHDVFPDARFHVVALPPADTVRELIVDDICNVDYAHFLSFHGGACKQVHQHSSWKIGAHVIGYLSSGKHMIVDFGVLKPVVKSVIKEFIDHKFLVKKEFVVDHCGGLVTVEYMTDVYHKLILPEEEVTIVDFETTVENLTRWLAQKILRKLPSNVTTFALKFYEGLDNGCISGVDRRIYGWDSLRKIIAQHVGIPKMNKFGY